MPSLSSLITQGKWFTACLLFACVWLPAGTCTYYVTPDGDTTWVAHAISPKGETTLVNADTAAFKHYRKIEVKSYPPALRPKHPDFGMSLLTYTWALIVLGASAAFRQRSWSRWIWRSEPIFALWFGAPFALALSFRLLGRPGSGIYVALLAHAPFLILWILEWFARRRRRGLPIPLPDTAVSNARGA